MPEATPFDPVLPVATGQIESGRLPVIGKRAEKSKIASEVLILIATIACTSAPVSAADDEIALAKQKNCMNCHAIDAKRVGPGYKAVAARYANDRDAEARLATKIREGGAGSWGVVPMPGNDVTSDEARRLAQWVLRQK